MKFILLVLRDENLTDGSFAKLNKKYLSVFLMLLIQLF